MSPSDVDVVFALISFTNNGFIVNTPVPGYPLFGFNNPVFKASFINLLRVSKEEFISADFGWEERI